MCLGPGGDRVWCKELKEGPVWLKHGEHSRPKKVLRGMYTSIFISSSRKSLLLVIGPRMCGQVLAARAGEDPW